MRRKIALLGSLLLCSCASQPITQEQLSHVSPFEMCVGAEIFLLTGSLTMNGHPVDSQLLADEGIRRDIKCEPRSYYQNIARARLQQEQIAAQNRAAQQQALAAALAGAAQQVQAQNQAQQAIDAQRQANYYQQHQAAPAQTTQCHWVLNQWTCTTQ